MEEKGLKIPNVSYWWKEGPETRWVKSILSGAFGHPAFVSPSLANDTLFLFLYPSWILLRMTQWSLG